MRSNRRLVESEKNISTAQDKSDEILDKWEEREIIVDVGNEPTEWCSNVVLTPKKDGENIRASLDMTYANKYIERTRLSIPTLSEPHSPELRHWSHLCVMFWTFSLDLVFFLKSWLLIVLFFT